MKAPITQIIRNTESTRYAVRVWRIGVGVFKPTGDKQGWVAVYSRRANQTWPSAEVYPWRHYVRIWNFAIVWLSKGLSFGCHEWCWPERRWV